MSSVENKKKAVFPKLVDVSGKPCLLQFGAFTLDLQSHGLYRGSERIHLTPKPFETLAVLVEHRGKTVEKQELLDAVWKEAFVTEDSLVKAVREIRRVLEDEKDSPQFIQTVPGEGYRFIAEVTPANQKIEHHPNPEPVETHATPDGQVAEVQESVLALETIDISVAASGQDQAGFWIRAAVVALLAALAAGILWRPWRKSESPAQRLIATFPAAHTSASFSPDGNWITFISDVDGVPQVWIKSLPQGEPRPITSGDLPASHSRWSPKNDEIVFSRGKGSQSIWSVPLLGGPPTLRIEGGRNPKWSWDGNRLVFERNHEIWTANADGGNQQKVDGVPKLGLLIADREPSLSPDGSLIAFFQPGDGPMGDIWVIPSSGGQPRQLTFDNHLGAGPVWTPDGDYIVFSSQRRGSKTLWKIHRLGGMPESVLHSPGEDTDPEISRDGAKLIYNSTRNHWVLTLMDVASGQTHELRETITDMYFPSLSPSGDKIAFFATVDEGDIHVFTIRTDGSEPTQVTRGKGERNVMPRWSADGSTLYFYQIRPTVSFRKISTAGGTSSEIAPGWRPRTHNGARVDPSGKSIVYSVIGETGVPVATLTREIETGRERVFKPTLDDPQWSLDGKFIVGTDLTSSISGNVSGDIVVCSVAIGSCKKVAAGGFLPIWPAGGSRIYFDRWKSRNSRQTWSVSPDGEGEKWIVDRAQVDPTAGFYDVSRKGEVVYVQFKPGKQELWMTDFSGQDQVGLWMRSAVVALLAILAVGIWWQPWRKSESPAQRLGNPIRR